MTKRMDAPAFEEECASTMKAYSIDGKMRSLKQPHENSPHEEMTLRVDGSTTQRVVLEHEAEPLTCS